MQKDDQERDREKTPSDVCLLLVQNSACIFLIIIYTIATVFVVTSY